jgi:antirestriction protein ArdC
MRWPAFLVGLVIAALGILGVVAPTLVLGIAAFALTYVGLYVAAAVRVVFGLVLDVNLEEAGGVVARSSRRRRLRAPKTELNEIERIDEDVDDAHCVILVDPVVQALRKQEALRSFAPSTNRAIAFPRKRITDMINVTSGNWVVFSLGRTRPVVANGACSIPSAAKTCTARTVSTVTPCALSLAWIAQGLCPSRRARVKLCRAAGFPRLSALRLCKPGDPPPGRAPLALCYPRSRRWASVHVHVHSTRALKGDQPMSNTIPSRSDVYARVTDRIITDLEAGVRPWLKPWRTGSSEGQIAVPRRHNGTPYRRINILLRWGAAMAKGYRSPLWMTYRQAGELKAHVRKGEQGSLVVFADRVAKTETNDPGEEVEREIAFMKGYTVFNVEQIGGLPAQYYAKAEPRGEPLKLIESAETFFAATGGTFRHGGDSAYYAPGPDYIQLPPPAAFKDAESLAAVKGHELLHWSGHPSRLARALGNRFGDHAYAAEELVELGAALPLR